MKMVGRIHYAWKCKSSVDKKQIIIILIIICRAVFYTFRISDKKTIKKAHSFRVLLDEKTKSNLAKRQNIVKKLLLFA